MSETRRLRRPLLLGALGLLPLLTGCTTLDRAVAKVPWFTTMRDQVAVRPFERVPGDTGAAPYFLPPEGSVPVTGREDSLDLFTPEGLRVVDAMANPIPVGDRDYAVARGRRIYDTYCAVCHGVQGKGDGTVAGKLGYVPDLTQDMTVQRSDGYLYAIVRHGRGVMPRYGDRIRDVGDRWRVVTYVRHLQGR
jgi:mono/diheme cytochrome c family protein